MHSSLFDAVMWQINVGKRDELVVSSDVTLKMFYMEDKEKERKLLQIVHECESSVPKGTRNSYIVFVVRLFVCGEQALSDFLCLKVFHVSILEIASPACKSHKRVCLVGATHEWLSHCMHHKLHVCPLVLLMAAKVSAAALSFS